MSDFTIFDVNKYAGYTQNEKEIFEAYRDSMILIFPAGDDGSYDDEFIEIAERCAFIFVDKFPEKVKNPPPPAPVGSTGTTGSTGGSTGTT